MNFLVGPKEPLLTRKETETCMRSGRRRGRQRKCWLDNIKGWTYLPIPELLTRASCRKDWKRIFAESSLMSPRRSNWSRDWTEPRPVGAACWNVSCTVDPEQDISELLSSATVSVVLWHTTTGNRRRPYVSFCKSADTLTVSQGRPDEQASMTAVLSWQLKYGTEKEVMPGPAPV